MYKWLPNQINPQQNFSDKHDPLATCYTAGISLYNVFYVQNKNLSKNLVGELFIHKNILFCGPFKKTFSAYRKSSDMRKFIQCGPKLLQIVYRKINVSCCGISLSSQSSFFIVVLSLFSENNRSCYNFPIVCVNCDAYLYQYFSIYFPVRKVVTMICKSYMCV